MGGGGGFEIPQGPVQGPGGGGPVPTGYGASQQPIDLSLQGVPGSFPSNTFGQAYQNIGNLYGSLGQAAPGYYADALNLSNQGMSGGLNQLGNIYGQGVGAQGALGQQAQGQIAGLENQNQGQVQSLLNNYDQSFMQSLGPGGNLGQQMAGEYNNYGITPSSGAFQQGLGNTLGQLGAQNALTLGQEALMPGIQAQYGSLGQTLGSQLGTSQQGTQQAGQLSNLGTTQGMNLLQQMGLAPLNYMNEGANMQAGLINQAAQVPIDVWGGMNNMNLATQLGNQNQQAQNNSAQMGLLGNLFGSGAGLAAAGK